MIMMNKSCDQIESTIGSKSEIPKHEKVTVYLDQTITKALEAMPLGDVLNKRKKHFYQCF